MASTGSSDVETEEGNTDQNLSPEKVGRAAEYPEFAIIWSYLENFYELLRFPELTLDGLEDAFNSHSARNENCRQLEYLHKKLLIKLHKNFRSDKWEKALLKVAKEKNMLSSWDLENFGYEELKVCTKLELFKMLLESQFDNHSKLKTAINKNYEAEDLRLQPFGYDMDGLIYWFHMDEVGGVRLYSTEEDEVESESWKLLASDLEELESVVEFLRLKSETNPKDIVLAKKEEEKKKEQENSKGPSKKKKKSKKVEPEELDDDNPCARCYSNVHPDSILLCDKCDAAYHTACLRPPLLTIPQGDWFCPFCKQLVLLERLKEKRTRLVARQKLRARQEKRLNKSGMNLSNILQGPGSDEEQIDAIRRSGRARKTVDYTFRDFDEEILDAVGTDSKRLKLDTEMNGHPTGKPAFAVEKFYTSSTPESAIGRRRSRRLKDLDSGSESDSKVSEYEYDGSTDEDRPKQPERHVYLRRHIIEDDDDEDNESGKCESDKENSEREELEETKESEENTEKESVEKDDGDDKKDDSLNDSQESTIKDTTDDTSSEKSGPTLPPASSNDNDACRPVSSNDNDTCPPASSDDNDTCPPASSDDNDTCPPASSDDNDTSKTKEGEKKQDELNKCEKNTLDVPKSKKQDELNKGEKNILDVPKSKKQDELNKGEKNILDVPKCKKQDELNKGEKNILDVPKSRPPPLERIASPKIDPLLDSLGFGALASFTNNDRSPSRPEPYGSLRSPSQDIRSPLSRPEAGYSTVVPPSPSSYPNVGADSRYGSYPNYDQSSTYGNYYGYNQTDYTPGSAMDTYPRSTQSSRQSYGLNMPGNRPFPGYTPPEISKRDIAVFSQTPQSSSFTQSPAYASSMPGYPAPYPSNDMSSGYYPSNNQGYGLTNKSPYGQSPQAYFSDEAFSTGMFYGNPSNTVQQGGTSSWPTPPTGSDSYFPQAGMGQNRTGL